MDYIQIIGYISTLIIAISLTPQVIKSWKTKSTKDISLAWNSVYLIGLLLFMVYAIGIMEIPLIIGNIIEVSLALSLIVAKLIYK
jgi:MtN3 and saliva related transmembrane protein